MLKNTQLYLNYVLLSFKIKFSLKFKISKYIFSIFWLKINENNKTMINYSFCVQKSLILSFKTLKLTN